MGQQQTNALVEERRRLTENERLRRQELADEFQHTIGDVKKKMDQQANERDRLARENKELRDRFKQFFEQYDTREKEELSKTEQVLRGQLQTYSSKFNHFQDT